MHTVTQALLVAEQLADRHGDSNQFKNDYTLLRENNGILDSLRGALVSQGLWDQFVLLCDRTWFNRNYG